MTHELVAQEPSNVAYYRASTDAAALCRDIVVASASRIGGRKYVCVEGWEAIAIAHGCAASAKDVQRVEGGYKAIGLVRRMSDGAIIAEGEGFVGEDEPTWFGGEISTKYGRKVLPKRADYAIRAMAQTRAISRACRSAFAHVVVMMNAGLSTTPAEEVPNDGFEDGRNDSSVNDAQQDNRNTKRSSISNVIDDAQLASLQQLAKAAGVSAAEICDAAECETVNQMPASKYEGIVKKLKLTISEKTKKDTAKSDSTDGEFAEFDDEISY